MKNLHSNKNSVHQKLKTEETLGMLRLIGVFGVTLFLLSTNLDHMLTFFILIIGMIFVLSHSNKKQKECYTQLNQIEVLKTLFKEILRVLETAMGSRSVANAFTVAFTTFCGLADPRFFARTSVIPAASRTARILPPAITPVP